MSSKKKTVVKQGGNADAARIQRTESYAESVRKAFADCVNSILALNKTLPKLDEGVMYSFDGDNKKKQKEVEALLRRLHSICTAAIERGIKLEWQQAASECNKLAQSAFGKAVLSTPEFKAWTERNKAAMNAYISRTEDGMNLSDRVWKSVNQLKDEMEVAMTVSIGEGESASQMSRKVRQYLNDPDLMFRRFRYKDKDGNWKTKWKKRVKDEKTGKVHFIDYDRDSYIPKGAGGSSRGVYKSAAKNAMRVARTETNIAYRRSDHQRWMDDDHVVGVRIHLSHNHPRKDICDKLQGDYPKSFVFDGWHPQCFCYATPITVEVEDMKKISEMILKGEDWRTELKRISRSRQITDYPQDFKDWVAEHKDNIAAARQRGTEPYFIRNNSAVIDELLNPKPMSETVKRARARQAARTPEQIDDIKNRWAQHEQRLATLKAADERHNARTPEQIADIRKRAQEWQAQKAHMRKTADNVLKEAANYGEIDYSALQSYVGGVQIQKMYDEALKVQKQIQETIKKEKALSALIPNAHDWHKQFTFEELQQVYDAVEKKIAGWSGLSLEQQKKKVAFEISYVEDPTKYNSSAVQHKTWQVAQEAYTQKQSQILYQIDVKTQSDKLTPIKSWLTTHTKSANVATLVAEAETAIAANADLSTITDKVALAEKEYKAMQAEAKRRAVEEIEKEAGKPPKFTDGDYTQERKDNALWAKEGMDAYNELAPQTSAVWMVSTKEERRAVFGYTNSYHNVNEPLRGITYYGSAASAKQGLARIPLIEKVIGRTSLPCDMWLQRGDGMVALKKFGLSNYNDATDAEVYALVGKEGVEGAFWSAGSGKGNGFSGEVTFNIYAPKGTKAMYLEPFSDFGKGARSADWDGTLNQTSVGYENETLLQRGTKFRVTKVEKSGDHWFIDLDVIEQEPVPFPYVGDYPFL